jgi:hypothetical protein
MAARRTKVPFFWLACCILLFSLVFRLQAGTIILSPVADTTLFESNTNHNLGGDATLASGATSQGLRSRALLRFDVVPMIPSNSTVISVRLTLTVTRTPNSGGKGSIFELRRVLQSWGEGKKTGSTGAPATAGEASWDARFFPERLWSGPGGSMPGDFSSTISSTTSIGSIGAYTFGPSSNLVADVESWLQNTDANFGWALLSQSENMPQTARRIGSREDKANAPVLVIEYSAPAQKFRIDAISINGKSGTMSCAGGTPPFQLQKKTSLNDPGWVDLGGPVLTNSVSFPVDSASAFFRVIEAVVARPP